MIKQVFIQIILCVGLILTNHKTNAQNSISLSTLNSVVMDFNTPIDPGSPVEPVFDNSKWLNYNVTVTSPGPPVSISVAITSGIISEGLQLQLQAGIYSGTGGGTPGIPAGILTLSSISQILIDNIGTCNTGSGVNVGHQLTYKLGISDYSVVKSSSSTVDILFTIIQQN